MADKLTAGQISRRAVIRRAAIAGGVVWTAPILQSLTSPAFASTVGSPPPKSSDDWECHYTLPSTDQPNGWWSCKTTDGSNSYDGEGSYSLDSSTNVFTSWAPIGSAGNVQVCHDRSQPASGPCLSSQAPDTYRFFEASTNVSGPVSSSSPPPTVYFDDIGVSHVYSVVTPA